MALTAQVAEFFAPIAACFAEATAIAPVAASIAVAIATAAAVATFALLAAALGAACLRALRFRLPREEEQLLASAAVGTIAIEMLLFFAQASGHVRTGVIAVLFAAVILAIPGYAGVVSAAEIVARRLATRASGAQTSAARASGTLGSGARASESRRLGAHAGAERMLAWATGIVVALEFLAAMAPLTGSDALHYHFAVPQEILARGFHPDFFLSHSFFCGQSHLLILLGLALGSEQLAMGLLFLGGILAAAAAACLASGWAGRAWCWATALVFLLTPVVFWQIATAGAPDIWMAFFAATGVIVVARAREMNSTGVAAEGVMVVAPGREMSSMGGGTAAAAVAGILAGGVAGTKYTGCIVAASVALAFILETRSARKTIVFALSALVAGIWPYARNFVWTGDPLFPFLMLRLHPERVNATALAGYLADTGATQARSLAMILKFPLFAWIDLTHLGFWQFFGPLVLAFAPLTIRAVRNTSAWRATLVVWIFSAAGIGWSSGMTRFLLPVFPIAIAAAMGGAAAIGGAAAVDNARWKYARSVSLVAMAAVAASAIFGAAGFLMYSRKAIAAAAGLISREEYLRAAAPDYEVAELVNLELKRKSGLAFGGESEREPGAALNGIPGSAGDTGNVLVFMRHLYYLRVPYVYGDPDASWGSDPARLQTPEEWRQFFEANRIEWVVRSPNYPAALAAGLGSLEASGTLVPVARGEATSFEGNRMHGVREPLTVEILRVNSGAAHSSLSPP